MFAVAPSKDSFKILAPFPATKGVLINCLPILISIFDIL